MAKPNSIYAVRTAVARLSRWTDGGAHDEFPVSFAELNEREQLLIREILKQLCLELDEYREHGGMTSASVLVAEIPKTEPRASEMKGPGVGD
jgi:hypothetical protein